MKEVDIESAVHSTQDRPSVIVSTLGQTRNSGNPWSAPTSPKRMVTDALANAMAVAKRENISKLVIMSMFGTGQSFNNLNFLMRFVMVHSNMDQTIEDHDLTDQIVKASGLTFVLARPAMLKGEQLGQIKDLGDEGEKASFMPSISMRMVADFLLDAVESNEWDGRTPVISA